MISLTCWRDREHCAAVIDSNIAFRIAITNALAKIIHLLTGC